MRVLLVDPSLFTAPYDAALSAGLRAAGVEPNWAVRALRANEEADLAMDEVGMRFYPLTDGPLRRAGGAWKAIKGVEHAVGLWRLERLARAYDIVHFQWAVLPTLDVRTMRRISRTRPVVLTVHDTTPFNGVAVNPLQVRGFEALFDAPDRLIVHGEAARERLVASGVAADKIRVVAHGPLALRCSPQPLAEKAVGRWRVVLFGRLQAYKGLDVLVEALGLLPEHVRARVEVIVAGEPLMPLEPIYARAAALGLNAPTLQIRPKRLSDQAMADLLGSADTFVFPYSAIEASGVLFLVGSLRKWMIASALGAFVDALGGRPEEGALVPPGDAAALAGALAASIGRVPAGEAQQSWAPNWETIGACTVAIYRDVKATRG